MSDADDKLSKMERIRREELERLEDTGKVLLQANEAVAINELRRALLRQAERDLLIEDLRGMIDTLTVGHMLITDEISKIKNAHGVLLRQQAELRERQDIIAAVCDAFAKKLEEDSNARLRLAAELADRD